MLSTSVQTPRTGDSEAGATVRLRPAVFCQSELVMPDQDVVEIYHEMTDQF